MERGAYDFEARLGKQFGFSDEYMQWLSKQRGAEWTRTDAQKFRHSPSHKEFEEFLDDLVSGAGQ